jgi:hypothetical protein
MGQARAGAHGEEGMNPFNQLPVDPALLRDVNETVDALAQKWGALVVVIVAQDDRKMIVTSAGDDFAPKIGKVAEDGGHFFALMSAICTASDAHNKVNSQ